MQKATGDAPNGNGILRCMDAGHARHVFSHKIWEMHLWTLQVTPEYDLQPPWRMVTASELSALPFPSAMRAAMKEARKLMGDEEPYVMNGDEVHRRG